jgi:hypothetical protein
VRVDRRMRMSERELIEINAELQFETVAFEHAKLVSAWQIHSPARVTFRCLSFVAITPG